MVPVADTRTSWTGALRGFGRNAYLLFIAAGVLGFVYWGITYLLTNLYVSRLGYGTDVVGNLNALFYLLHMVLSVPAGALGMRLGGRRSLLLGGALAIAGWAIAPAASFLLYPSARISALIVSRVISSAGGALFIVNAGPALIGAVDPRTSTYAFAFNGTVVSLTTVLGSICGGFLPPLFSALTAKSLASSIPYAYALWTGVLILAHAMLAVSFFHDTERTAEAAPEQSRRGAPVAIILVIVGVRFLRECGYGGVLNFFNVYLDSTLRLQTSLIGILVSFSSVTSIIFTPLMPLVARRWGTGPTSLAGLLVMGASVLVIGFTRHWLSAAVGWAGMTAANTINETAMQVYILNIVAPQWRALMSGAANAATTLGLAFSSFAGGYLIGALGYPALFGISAAFIFASSAVFTTHLAWRGRRRA
jgi:MFS family permease